MIDQKLLQVPAFSFYYSKSVDDPSALLLGPPDPAFYTGKITWLPVTRQFYWEIRKIQQNDCDCHCHTHIHTYSPGCMRRPFIHPLRCSRCIAPAPLSLSFLTFLAPLAHLSTRPPLLTRSALYILCVLPPNKTN